MAMVILLMGVAGSGKTTIGEMLARKLGWPFFDADRFHPPENVAKMAAGVPLEDADRWPWLARVRGNMEEELAAGRSAVFACSALKQSYRDFLLAGHPEVKLVYLKGDAELIALRIAGRSSHFMKAEMLASQLEALEEPSGGVTVDVTARPEQVVARIGEVLRLKEAFRNTGGG